MDASGGKVLQLPWLPAYIVKYITSKHAAEEHKIVMSSLALIKSISLHAEMCMCVCVCPSLYLPPPTACRGSVVSTEGMAQ